jgi:hypothetical protein
MRDRTDVRLAGKCERRSGMSAAAVLEKRKVGDVWMQNIQDLLENWYSTDGCNPGGWRYTLKCKREDRWYNDVVKSLKKHGFTRPLTCYVRNSPYLYNDPPEGTLVFGDGHHRLAAAIDLGMTEVPLEFKPDSFSAIRHDSYEEWKREI